LTAAIYMLVETVFWFHPLVWWIGKRLVAERELACDEEVLHLGNQPKVYAQGILKVCQRYLESPLECVAGVTGSNLRRRIRAIMTHRGTTPMNAGKKLLLAAAGMAAVAGPLAIGILNAPRVEAQPAAAPLSFEVVSVKPDNEGPSRTAQARILPGDRTYVVSNYNLQMLIMTAYGLDFAGDRISGVTDWMRSERYDIEAKSDRPFDRAQGMFMLQKLLADRFKLKLRREPKEVSIYALVVDKNGPRLHDTDGGPYGVKRGERGQTIYHNASMLSLTQMLPGILHGSPVEDKTGLKGRYDFDLEFTPDRPVSPDAGAVSDPSGPDIFTALREQLGLRLESQKGQVEFFVIEHAEKPSEN
jgi:uncharacterized protein (TIGR03435 family)